VTQSKGTAARGSLTGEVRPVRTSHAIRFVELAEILIAIPLLAATTWSNYDDNYSPPSPLVNIYGEIGIGEPEVIPRGYR